MVSRRRSDLLALLALTLLCIGLFRNHVLGCGTMIGNSDRLNTHLSFLKHDVESIQGRGLAGWNEGIFMGVNQYALPFQYPGPDRYLFSPFPLPVLYRLAGFVSLGLLILAAAAAYGFIRECAGTSFPAFIGATLYAFSTFAVQMINQHDHSFGVLVLIPPVLLCLRKSGAGSMARWTACVAGLLSLLVWFVFLQMVAYAVMLFGAYAAYRGIRLRTWRPVLVFFPALLCSILLASPRLLTVAEEMKEADRTAPGYDLSSFEAVTTFQNIRPIQGLRLLNDDLLGRHPAEMQALNNMNGHEGMLAYTSGIAALLLFWGILRLGGKWGGVFRTADRDYAFFIFWIGLAFSVVLVDEVRRVVYLLFWRADFTHSRIVVTALLPFCTIVGAFVSDLLTRAESSAKSGWWRVASAGSFALVVVSLLNGLETHRFTDAVGLPRTWSWGSTANPVELLVGPLLRTVAGLVVLTGLLLLLNFRRLGNGNRSFLALTLGLTMTAEAYVHSDYRMNGHQNRRRIFFQGDTWVTSAPEEFRPPTSPTSAALQSRLESTRFRTALVSDPEEFPALCPTHISLMYRLRLVEGYSSFVPHRLAALPWPSGVRQLRSLSIPSLMAVPWALLAALNVKYVVVLRRDFYANWSDAHRRAIQPEDLEVLPNPCPVTPREFWVASIRPVRDIQEGAAWYSSSGPSGLPARESVAENYDGPRRFSISGEIHAEYRDDAIDVRVTPYDQPRFLVLNELYHPRWRAYSNGRELKVYPTNVVMRGVVVPPNTTQLQFRFQPYLATPIALWPVMAGLAILGGILVACRCQDRNAAPID